MIKSDEIAEGLMHCNIYKVCARCPYQGYLSECKKKLTEDAVTLIKDQKERIDRLEFCLKMARGEPITVNKTFIQQYEKLRR